MTHCPQHHLVRCVVDKKCCVMKAQCVEHVVGERSLEGFMITRSVGWISYRMQRSEQPPFSGANINTHLTLVGNTFRLRILLMHSQTEL